MVLEDLDPGRWQRIDDMLAAALDVPVAERARFLAVQCGHDPDLRAEVESLLEAWTLAGPAFTSLREPLARLGRPSGSFRADDRIGPFRLIREIGRGGMGVVLLAEDTRIGRNVAIKVLRTHLGEGRRARARFESEARALSSLDHPNIATLHAFDRTDAGQLYMVFAYYEGETLAARIDRGTVSVAEAIEVATGVSRGLQAAHARGIVHRDVKPSNVLLTKGGGVKLLDFGVAKIIGEDMTQEDVRPGTAAYMSPEQARGGPVDRRADLWALGVVLHEMVAGERPDGETDPLPGGLDPVVRRLMSTSPANRYQSAADVLTDLQSLATGLPPNIALTTPPSSSPWRRSGRRRTAVAARAGALALVIGGALWLVRSGTAPPAVERVAVLPMADVTGDSGQGHLVQGFHAALIAELGAVGSVGVSSRTSVQRYRGAELGVAEIAAELGVDAIIEGSVGRRGDSLDVTASLVEASADRQLWAGRYRMPVGDIYEVAAEVVRGVVEAIGVELAPEQRIRLAANRRVRSEAYDAYALGEFHLQRGDREGFGLAQRYFRRAMELDPGFAAAHAGLAEALGRAAFFGFARPRDIMPTVKALAESARRLDPASAEAHTTLAAVTFYWEWDWARAEALARRALELNPSRPATHRTLSEILSTTGRYEEALQSVERGSELDRFVEFSTFQPAVVLYYMRDFDGALRRAREGLEFFSDFWQGRFLICLSSAGRGEFETAIPECEAAVETSGGADMSIGALGYVYAAAGRFEEAERVVADMERASTTRYVSAALIAAVYGALGEADSAFEWLERAHEDRDVRLVHLNEHVLFDPLRGDPRFAALLERMGLPGREP